MPNRVADVRTPRVFVNYRREDSSAYAGRIYDRISRIIPGGNIFMDVDTLKPGVDFEDAIKKAISGCDIFLILIGPKWITTRDASDQPRILNPHDFVRIEIANALLQSSLIVIPVLIDGAEIPAASQLPDDLVAITRRNAIELRHSRFTDDIRHLIEQTGLSVFERPSNFVEIEKTFSALGDIPLRQVGYIFGSTFYNMWVALHWLWGQICRIGALLERLFYWVASAVPMMRLIAHNVQARLGAVFKVLGWNRGILGVSALIFMVFYSFFGNYVFYPARMIASAFVPYSTPSAEGFASAIAYLISVLVILSTSFDLPGLPRRVIKIFVYSLCFSFLFGSISNTAEDRLMFVRSFLAEQIKLPASTSSPKPIVIHKGMDSYRFFRSHEVFSNPFGQNIYADRAEGRADVGLARDEQDDICVTSTDYCSYKTELRKGAIVFVERDIDLKRLDFDLNSERGMMNAIFLALNSLVAIQILKTLVAMLLTWCIAYFIYSIFSFWVWRIVSRSQKKLRTAREMLSHVQQQ